MITSAEEFIRLRESADSNEQYRATHDSAEIKVWQDIINKFPDFKSWITHNKTIQIEILEHLAEDDDPNVRSSVAMKR